MFYINIIVFLCQISYFIMQPAEFIDMSNQKPCIEWYDMPYRYTPNALVAKDIWSYSVCALFGALLMAGCEELINICETI